MKKKFEKNIFGLIINNALNNIISIYINTFLVAYILNISLGNFFNVALYYFIGYIVMMASYTIFSHLICIVKKIHILRGAIIINSIALTLIAILQEKIISFLIPIAILYNIYNGMYWSSNDSISNEIIQGKKLQTYNTYNSVVTSITSIVVPVIFGGIIDSSSILVISVFASIISILQILSTFLFDNKNFNKHKFNLKGYYNDCYNKGHKNCYNLLYFTSLIYGLRDGLSVLITILIVLTFKTNTNLGTISSLISCLTILILIVTNKIYGKKNASWFLITSIVTVSSMFALIMDINKTSIIFFNIAYASLLSINNRSYVVKRNGIIRAVDKKDYIAEHQATSEIFLNLGRVIFFAILLFVSSSSEIWVYKTILAISIIFVALYGISTYLLEKEYEKILIEREFKKQINRMIEDHEYFVPTYSNHHLHEELNCNLQ